MKSKYPNKKKRLGFWKRYEHAKIKDFRKVWNLTLELVAQKGTPFKFSKFSRKPNLTKEEYVCVSVVYAYFDMDFREVENVIPC